MFVCSVAHRTKPLRLLLCSCDCMRHDSFPIHYLWTLNQTLAAGFAQRTMFLSDRILVSTALPIPTLLLGHSKLLTLGSLLLNFCLLTSSQTLAVVRRALMMVEYVPPAARFPTCPAL